MKQALLGEDEKKEEELKKIKQEMEEIEKKYEERRAELRKKVIKAIEIQNKTGKPIIVVGPSGGFEINEYYFDLFDGYYTDEIVEEIFKIRLSQKG